MSPPRDFRRRGRWRLLGRSGGRPLAGSAAPQDERAREAIRAFCAQSPDYHAAWEEAKRVYRVTGEAVGARPRRRTLSRRQVVAGVAAVAAGSVAALQAPGLVRRLRADEVTAVGASSLAIADWLGRNLLFPWEIPAGMMAALISTPYLVWLLSRRR